MLLLFYFFIINSIHSESLETSSQWKDSISIPQTLPDKSSGLKVPLLFIKKQNQLLEELKKKWFAPWESIRIDEHIFPNQINKKTVYYGVNQKKLTNKQIIDINNQIKSTKKKKCLFLPAITIQNVDCRIYPYTPPLFGNPDQAGQGFPFDLCEETRLYPNTPILILLESPSKEWLYVKTPYGYGWIISSSIAFMNTKMIQMYKNASLGCIIKDNLSLVSLSKQYIATVKIGTIVPIIEKNPKDKTVLFWNLKGEIEKVKITHNDCTELPYQLTLKNIKQIVNQLLKEPYGWGGLFGWRDCSMLTKDFFMPFGIWLERNSVDQARGTNWETYNLEKLNTKERLELIQDKGRPFLTLLYKPGHIAIYCGVNQNNNIIILQNIWGLKTIDKHQKEGRFVIGQTVLSSLFLGKNNPLIPKESLLVHSMTQMHILTIE